VRYASVGLVLVAAAMAMAAGSGCATPTERAEAVYTDLELATKIARDHVYPATVRVDARRTEYVGGEKRRLGGSGSGVIFDDAGHILTNYHVAGRAEELTCILFSKERVKAKLIGSDPWTDLAVIQLDPDEIREKGLTFVHATFGDSDRLEEGDKVLAIGSPFGLSRSISSGIISCRDRILGTGLETGGGLETGLFNTWIQTDAAINPGNSGGPLVNYHGEVIGINTRGGGNDLGFAVPISVAKDVVAQILAKGKVTRSTIGIVLQPLQDLETFFDVGKTAGAVVSSVEPDTPAAKAGIRAEDVLQEIGGVKVEGRYPEQLFDIRRRIAATPVGDKVSVKVKRGGEVRTMDLVTEELTTVRGDESNFPLWGLVVQGITDRLAQRETLPTTKGIYVTGVRGGEPAQKGGVERGDVIDRVGDVEVASLKEFQAQYDATVARKVPMVLFRVRRGPASLPVVIKVDYEKAATPPRETPATKPATEATPGTPETRPGTPETKPAAPGPRPPAATPRPAPRPAVRPASAATTPAE
jgi:serine protease Do